MIMELSTGEIIVSAVVLAVSAGFWVAGYIAGRDLERMLGNKTCNKTHLRRNRP